MGLGGKHARLTLGLAAPASAELSPAELALLAEYEATIGAADAALPRHETPDLTSGVMARIAALEAPQTAARPATATATANPLARAYAWLVTPRPIAFRPAWGLAAAALAAVALVTIERDAEVAPIVAEAPATARAEIYVSFRLDAPDAQSVHLAGDFTDWEPEYELHQSQPGVWTVVVPLEAGVHDYAFVIDGETWTPDPLWG